MRKHTYNQIHIHNRKHYHFSTFRYHLMSNKGQVKDDKLKVESTEIYSKQRSPSSQQLSTAATPRVLHKDPNTAAGALPAQNALCLFSCTTGSALQLLYHVS